ncbi:hypothetical protein [Rhizobium ruizarguesonis]|uniref:hypothetical protein n=1 Tax=Rhizobium ruizarguesonis TaxID=2081791 RepID=UPI00102FFE14|nr:hypothetical protein [Rhizobium ruizarguesonis]TAT84803.1 hypothetical protein ELI52_15515 [Rhizobium ruizarguesonis]
MISAKAYVRALSEWPIPDEILQTKPSTADSEWSSGEKRSLVHQCWKVVTADLSLKHTGGINTVSFDTPIAFPNRNLVDPDLRDDNLSKKRFVLRATTVGVFDTSGQDGQWVAQIARNFDWVLRFRHSRGLSDNYSLSADDFDDFREILRTGEILDLLPIEEYLLTAADEVATILKDAPEDGFNWDALSRLLGVTSASLSRSAWFAGALIDSQPEVFISRPELIMKLRQGIRAEGEGPARARNQRSPSARSNSRAYYDVWDYLNLRRRRGDAVDGLSFDPFKFTSKKALTADTDRETKGRTPTVMPEDMFRLISSAADWINRFGNYIVDAYLMVQAERHPRQRRELARALQAKMPKGAPVLVFGMTAGKTPKQQKAGELSVTIAVGYLLSAVAMLILFFGARRLVEGSSLKFGCLYEEKAGLLELETYLAKTRQGLGRVPVPAIVRTAVEMLERLSEPTRRATGSDWLFDVAMDVESPNRFISKRFSIGVKKFVTFLRVPPPQGEEAWDLGSHVFRRGFGIWYIHGLEGASSDPLSILYDHWDPRMTRIYFTLVLPGKINQLREDIARKQRSARQNRSEELQAWLKDAYKDLQYLKDIQVGHEDARCRAFVQKMFAVWMRKEIPIGAAGRRLYNDVREIANRTSARVRIGSRANDPEALHQPVIEAFGKFARTHLLSPVIGTNIHCMASPNDPENERLANCLTLKTRVESAPWPTPREQLPESMPAFDLATDPLCVDCYFCAIFKDGRKRINRALREERSAIVMSATSQIREESERRMEAFRAKYAAQLASGRAKP